MDREHAFARHSDRPGAPRPSRLPVPARRLARLAPDLDATLCIVMSKSGGTPETRNGMLLAAEAYRAAGLDFAKHAVAVLGTAR